MTRSNFYHFAVDSMQVTTTNAQITPILEMI